MTLIEQVDLTNPLMADVTSHTFSILYEKIIRSESFDLPSVSELVNLTLEMLLEDFQIPDYLNHEELLKALSNRVLKYLNDEDKELGEIIEELMGYEDVPTDTTGFHKFVGTFSRFSKKSSSLIDTTVKQNLAYLYGSDIPYSIIAKLALVEYTNLALIQFLDDEGNKIVRQTSKARPLIQRSRYQQYRRLMNRLSEASLEARIWATRVRLYLHVANVKSTSELFKPNSLSFASIDKKELRRIVHTLDEKLSNIRHLLLKESKSIFQKYPRKTDKTGQTLWSELMLLRVE